MDLNLSPRHSRRWFSQQPNSAGLAANFVHSKEGQAEIIDFSPDARTEPILNQVNHEWELRGLSRLAAEISATQSSCESSFKTSSTALLDRAEIAYGAEAAQLLGAMSNAVPKVTRCAEETETEYRDGFGTALERIKGQRLKVRVQQLSDGKRTEVFENGSIVNKDALGRVVEVSSRLGESMFFSYDSNGELVSFKRIDSNRALHSTGERGRNGVTVRDGQGRVKALGECMTVDPWGRFYLHTHDDQYFCLDLVAGVHCERRCLINLDGELNFLTAAFTHDGFRMATVYAKGVAPDHLRVMTYRFYGRDGTVIEFSSEHDFNDLNPSRSLPPGSFPVHATWMRRHQAHTAWESVREYLCRVS